MLVHQDRIHRIGRVRCFSRSCSLLNRARRARSCCVTPRGSNDMRIKYEPCQGIPEISHHFSPTAMEVQYSGLAHTLQTVAIATLVFAACALLPKLNYRSKMAKLPVFGGQASGEKQRQTFLFNAKKIYLDGYEKATSPAIQRQRVLTFSSSKTLSGVSHRLMTKTPLSYRPVSCLS